MEIGKDWEIIADLTPRLANTGEHHPILADLVPRSPKLARTHANSRMIDESSVIISSFPERGNGFPVITLETRITSPNVYVHNGMFDNPALVGYFS